METANTNGKISKEYRSDVVTLTVKCSWTNNLRTSNVGRSTPRPIYLNLKYGESEYHIGIRDSVGSYRYDYLYDADYVVWDGDKHTITFINKRNGLMRAFGSNDNTLGVVTLQQKNTNPEADNNGGGSSAAKRSSAAHAWTLTSRKAKRADGSTRSLYRNAGFPGQLRVKRMVTRRGTKHATYVKP